MTTHTKNLLSNRLIRLAPACLLAALASLILAGSSQGQIVTKDKKLQKGPAAKSGFDPAKSIFTDNTKISDIGVQLAITQFSVVRDGGPFVNKIVVKGMVGNSGFKASAATTYTVSRVDVGVWKVVKTGTLPAIAAGGSQPILHDEPLTTTGGQYKLEVAQPPPGQNKPALARTAYLAPVLSPNTGQISFDQVVEYQCVQKFLYKHEGDLTTDNYSQSVEPIRKEEQRMQALGFLTHWESYRHPYVFGQDRLEYSLYILPGGVQTKTFKTRAEAERFKATLPQRNEITIRIKGLK